MKKITVFSFLTLLLSLVIFIACSKDNNSETKVEETYLRETFLKNKDFSTIKSDFNTLKKEDKISLWNEKLSQLLKQEVSSEHKRLINALLVELNKNEVNQKSISEISISLAEITPEDDFFKMFACLDDYKFNGHFAGTTKVSQDVINTLASLKFNYNSNDTTNKSNASTLLAADCNCNWTCSWYGTSSTNCKITSSGCGFLWAFECENRV